MKIFEAIQDKYSQDLDIVNIISKLRDCHDLIKNLKIEGKKEFLRFNESRVVEVGSSEDEDEDQGEKEGEKSLDENKYIKDQDQAENEEEVRSLESSNIEFQDQDSLTSDFEPQNIVSINNSFLISIIKGLPFDSSVIKNIILANINPHIPTPSLRTQSDFVVANPPILENQIIENPNLVQEIRDQIREFTTIELSDMSVNNLAENVNFLSENEEKDEND